MALTATHQISPKLLAFQAILLGLAAPLVVLGRAELAITAGLAAIVLVYRLIQDQAWHYWLTRLATPLGASLGGMFSWWLLSSLFAHELGNALEVWARCLLLVLLLCELARQLSLRQEQVRWFMRAMVLGVIPISLYIILIAYIDSTPISLLEAIRGREVSLIRVFKPYSSVMACMLPIAFWWGFKDKGIWRLLSWCLIPIGLAVIYHNGIEISRAAVMGVLASIIGTLGCFLLIKLPVKLQRSLIAAGLAFAVIGGIWFLQALPRMPFDGMKLPEIALPFPDLHRQVIWGFLYDLIVQNPLLGVGIDGSNLLPEARNEVTLNLVEKVETVQMIGSHPHNWVLEVAVETGLPGLVLAVSSLLLFARAVLRAEAMGSARWAAIAVIFAFWVSSLANFSIWSGWWQGCFVILMGALLAYRDPALQSR